MSSLAAFVNRFVGVRDLADAPSAVWTRVDTPRLRPLANEDVYLFVKRIDNSTVIREVDHEARKARSRSTAFAFAAAVVVIAGLLPYAYNFTANLSLQQLRQERAVLERDRATLRTTEAQLVSPDRLRQLAKTLKMSEPQPQQVQMLSGAGKAEASAEAFNTLPFAAAANIR